MALLGRAAAAAVAGNSILSASYNAEHNQLVGAAGVLNGGGSGFRILTKYSHGTEPVYEMDQLGAGAIALFKQNGVTKLTVTNGGLLNPASSAVNTGFNADQVDGIEGANIAKLDTNVAAWAAHWFYPVPPGATESTESTNVFVCPTGTAITVTKLRIIFRGGSHTGGTVLTFSIEKRNSSGGGSISVGTVTIDNSGPAITVVSTNDVGDVAMSDGDYLNCRLTTRTGSPTETLITVVALGTQRLT